MKFPWRLSISKVKDDEAQPVSGCCRARIGIDIFCTNPTRQGKNLCDFHDSLAGPWANADKVFKKL